MPEPLKDIRTADLQTAIEDLEFQDYLVTDKISQGGGLWTIEYREKPTAGLPQSPTDIDAIAIAEPEPPNPAAGVPQPTPAAPQPAPIASQPTPVVLQPTPVVPQPILVPQEPAPAIPQPGPTTSPASTISQPAPTTPTPATAAPQPLPVPPRPPSTPVPQTAPAPSQPAATAAPQPPPVASQPTPATPPSAPTTPRPSPIFPKPAPIAPATGGPQRLGPEGAKLIKAFEACATRTKDGRFRAYKDAIGVLTIGWGHTNQLGRQFVSAATWSQGDCDEAFLEDMAHFEAAVHKLVRVPLKQHQFDALVSFCYNCGAGNLAKSTLLKKINAGDFAGAAPEFGKWVKADGKTLKGLVRRRASEALMFRGLRDSNYDGTPD